MPAGPRHTESARTEQRTPPTKAMLLLNACLLRPLPNNSRCLESRYLTTAAV
jgi:hypothetical protein